MAGSEREREGILGRKLRAEVVCKSGHADQTQLGKKEWISQKKLRAEVVFSTLEWKLSDARGSLPIPASSYSLEYITLPLN